MANPLYARLRGGTAHALLTKFGQDVVFRRKSAGSYSVEDGDYASTVVAYAAKAATLPMNSGTLSDFGIDENHTFRAVRYVLMSARDVTVQPMPGDEVDFEGVTWRVEGALPLSPAGVNVIHQLAVSR